MLNPNLPRPVHDDGRIPRASTHRVDLFQFRSVAHSLDAYSRFALLELRAPRGFATLLHLF